MGRIMTIFFNILNFSLFNKEKYGLAQYHFQNAIDKYGQFNVNNKVNAEFYSALCAIELFNNDAEYLISLFI